MDRNFKIGKINISAGFILVLATLYFFDFWNIFIFPAFLLHELGHLAAVKMLGGKIKNIDFSASGMCMKLAARPVFSYQKELLATLAGPVVSILCAVIGSFAGFKLTIFSAYTFAGINIVTAVFNLLPVSGLDGGRALFLLIAYLKNPDIAEKILIIVSCAVIFILLCLGYRILLITGYNFTLILTAVYLLPFIKKQKGIVKI